MRAPAIRLLFLACAAALPACGGGGGIDELGAGPSPIPFLVPHGGADGRVTLALGAGDGTGDYFVAGYLYFVGSQPVTGYFTRIKADGTVAPGFSIGSGFNAPPACAIRVGDGSGDIIVGGSFTQFNGVPQRGLVRMHPDGSLAPGFNAGLTAEVDTLTSAGDGTGDFFASGNGSLAPYAESLVRFHSDGTRDTGFTSAVSGLFYVSLVCRAADGSGDLYVAGPATSSTSPYTIVRLNSDGTLDTVFAVGAGFNSFIAGIVPAIDGSGDIYVAGAFTTYQGAAAPRMLRLNPDGTVDSGFDSGTGFDSSVYSVIAAPDGSGDLIAGGWFTSYNGTAASQIIRLNADGTIDGGFAYGSGFTPRPGDSVYWVWVIASADDGTGDIIVGSGIQAYQGVGSSSVTRIAADGSPNGGALQSSGFNDTVSALSALPDGSGRVYAGGAFQFFKGAPVGRIVRLLPDATVDPAFNTGAGFSDVVSAIVPVPDGSGDLYVAGNFTQYNGQPAPRIIRLHADGSIDPSFNPGTGLDAGCNRVAVASDGSGDLYLSGNFTQYDGAAARAIVRVTASGTRVAGFSTDNVLAGVRTIASAPNPPGSLFVGGSFTTYRGLTHRCLMKLLPSGAPDPSFSTGAGFTTAFPEDIPYVTALLPRAGGDVYVGGHLLYYQGQSVPSLIRLTASGARDNSFHPNPPVADGPLQSVDDGTDDFFFGPHRLRSSGGYDPFFAVSAVGITAIEPLRDGSQRVFIGGNFTTVNGIAADRIARLLRTGAVD